MSECCAYFAGDMTSGELRLLPAHVLEELAESPQVRLYASFVPVAITKISRNPPDMGSAVQFRIPGLRCLLSPHRSLSVSPISRPVSATAGAPVGVGPG